MRNKKLKLKAEVRAPQRGAEQEGDDAGWKGEQGEGNVAI